MKREPYLFDFRQTGMYNVVWSKLHATYHIFRLKQIAGKQENYSSVTVDIVCKNCGTVHQSNYCPNCGQSHNVDRLSFKYIFSNFFSDFFNIDNRIIRTIVELLYRPGYMIRDYLNGKRVHYYKPFQLLFVLAALYIIFAHIIDPQAFYERQQVPSQTAPVVEVNNDDTAYESIEPILESFINKYFHEGSHLKGAADLVKSWVQGNKAFYWLYIIPFMAIGTYRSFRGKNIPHKINFTETFYAQVYYACQFLILSLLLLFTTRRANMSFAFDFGLGIMFLLYLWNNGQLYGISFWKNIKHTLWAYVIAALTATIVAIGILIVVITFIVLLYKSSNALQ